MPSHKHSCCDFLVAPFYLVRGEVRLRIVQDDRLSFSQRKKGCFSQVCARFFFKFIKSLPNLCGDPVRFS